jgi:aspartyl-tRNA(Asn)/glutamyl-tRNA(Gln) amidotransferase subunit A
MTHTIAGIQEALLSGVSALSITERFLQRIDEHKHLNAFLEVFTESAIEQAKIVDEKIKNGTAGRLAGVVIGIKDNICYRGYKVTAASKILSGFESLFTATALQRLIDEDAIIIGRLNCDEFAMGGSNENSAYGVVENNWGKNRVPGGSSGGSAVAVSAQLCTVALGSDTGGSVRQPASWTNTFGIKPTYGRISRYGLIAYASSFDQIGVFANNLEDTALIYSVMEGVDEMDATSSSSPKGDYTKIEPAKGSVGVIKDYLNHPGLDKEVAATLHQLVQNLKDAGHEIIEFEFPYLDHVVPTYYVLTTAEASSNLSRFDGVHYGHRSSNAKGVDQTYVLSRTEGFGSEVKRRIMTGTFVLSHGYYDAYYTKAQKVRRLLKDATNAFFEKVDVLLLPTTTSTAFEIGAINDPIQMYLQDIFTVHANLTGNPAINVPGPIHSNGMPYGVQLMCAPFREDQLFSFSKTVEALLK